MTREQQGRDKRIEEIRNRLYDTPNRDVAYLLTEVSRLQVERDEWKAEAYKLANVEVERDKAIEGLKSLAYDLEHNLLTYDEVKQDCLRYLSELGVPQ